MGPGIDVNHRIAQAIVEPGFLIGLEDLTHIRERTQYRPGKGLMFRCKECGFTLHADLVGARNFTLRTLLIRQDWMGTGYLSASPDGSDAETKARRLNRFLELRWSPDPSSGL